MSAEKGLAYTLLLLSILQVSTCLDILNQNNAIEDGNLLISSGKKFVLGFFSPGNSSHRYVGIWYYQVSEQTVVWVANRERPLSGNSGALSIDSSGNLVLHETNGTFPVWSTNVSSALSNYSTTARLLDSGNLVLVQNFSERVIWQSFDYPTDTMLPYMKLGLNRKTGLNMFLTSWRSPEDPTPGNCSHGIDPMGYPQLFVYKDGVPYWRAGPWTGERLSGTPEMNQYIFNASFVNDPNEVYITYGLINTSIITRMVLNESGLLQRSTWHDRERRWVEFWFSPKDQCDIYGKCGSNSNCNPYNAGPFECTCLPGYEPKYSADWYLRDGSGGCVRRGGVSMCRSGEGFVKVAHVKLPDTSKAGANMSLSLKECKEECLKDCSCTAYASANVSFGGFGCVQWHGDLVDIRTFSDSGQDLYLRVDAIELARSRKTRSFSQRAMVAIILVSILTALPLVGSFLYRLMMKKRRDRRQKLLMSNLMNSTHLDGSQSVKDRNHEPRGNRDVPLFDLSTIASATDNFSIFNKLGQGGFGSVYKGIMDNGTEIAVKRLSKHSGQGVEEFKNEVRLIAKLQHRNLVRILGCCVEEDEKMIIYEYLPNKSLDALLFDKTKRSLVDWRKRFEIASGVARGLLYLHQDSRLRIIHRDLKASNVLLDVTMNPKISDFGMARICGGDQIQGNTNRVVGTYGYMSPEYAMEGIFSIKSDVYSFGVLLLEIISGKKNSSCNHENPYLNLVGHVWELWQGGNCDDIINESIGDSCSKEEALRCIQIGLLCVQELAKDRPNMSAVVFMLANSDVVLASPKRPAYIFKSKQHHGANLSATASDGTASANDVTISMMEGR